MNFRIKNLVIKISALIIILTFVPVSLPINAAEKHEEVVVSEASAEAQRELKPYYGESEKITVLDTAYKTVTVTPSGQLPNGENFPTGGGLWVAQGGGADISFSVSLAWEFISFSVNAGFASGDNIVGKYVQFPADNHYYKVKIDKRIKFEHHKVDVYQYNEYKYTYYTTVNSVDAASNYLQRIS